MTALTRGPLPARVYWRRRLLVAVLALGLVVGVAWVLGRSSDGSSQTPQATQVAAKPSSSPATTEPPATEPPASEPVAEPRASWTHEPDRDRQDRDGQRGRRGEEPVLAEPEGVCADRDVAVTPSVRDAVGGSPVTFTLELRTITTPACTWQVAPTTLTMKITSGSDDIWSSRQCPRAIPTEEVVVRDNVSTEVEATWSGRRSDEECSQLTEWAMPGWYWVNVAALAGEPSDLHFELTPPEPRVEKRTVRPERHDRLHDAKQDRKQDRKQDVKQQDRKQDRKQDGEAATTDP
jgi:hypothetical protein